MRELHLRCPARKPLILQEVAAIISSPVRTGSALTQRCGGLSLHGIACHRKSGNRSFAWRPPARSAVESGPSTTSDEGQINQVCYIVKHVYNLINRRAEVRTEVSSSRVHVIGEPVRPRRRGRGWTRGCDVGPFTGIAGQCLEVKVGYARKAQGGVIVARRGTGSGRRLSSQTQRASLVMCRDGSSPKSRR